MPVAFFFVMGAETRPAPFLLPDRRVLGLSKSFLVFIIDTLGSIASVAASSGLVCGFLVGRGCLLERVG